MRVTGGNAPLAFSLLALGLLAVTAILTSPLAVLAVGVALRALAALVRTLGGK